jgi:hypothetical protein
VIGRKGRETTKTRQGTAHYQRIGKIGRQQRHIHDYH